MGLLNSNILRALLHEPTIRLRYEDEDLLVSTIDVPDGKKPYETCISSPYYRGGLPIIVEAYETKEAAKTGHRSWVTRMIGDSPPDKLVDCQNVNWGQEEVTEWPRYEGE